MATAAALLRRDDVRLLTVTGPGGVGKTRLVQAVAQETADSFADGVIFVPLQSVRDPDHVIGTIARSLGLFDGEGDLEERLVAHIEGRRLLLVLDNFEQVVEAAPALAAVIAASPHLKVAVTSRTRLRVSGERELLLEPLSSGDAVTLFLERALAVRSGFEPDENEIGAIAAICDRLDCLPLAVELAAARIKLLTPTAMLGRLEHSLELLTSGSRDAPARHRALRDAIDWSVDLLDEDQAALFRRLSVFVGGCSLHAAEDVCGGDVNSLGALVDESLVRAEAGRFTMLETIGEYARERLEASSETKDLRRAHATHYLSLARTAASSLASSNDPATWRAILETDHDNLRAALRFSLDTGSASTALELCAVLWRFWFERGFLSEGRLWLDASLAASPEASPDRARALSGNGVLAHYQGDYDAAEALCREALELSRALSDRGGIAEAQTGLGLVRRARADYPEAETLFREALAGYESLGDDAAIARGVDRLAMHFVVVGDDARARALFEESLARFRALGDSHGIALGLYGLAVTRPADALSAARAQAEESLEILRSVGDRRTFGKVLWCVAGINADLGAAETAAAQLEESLTLFIEFGDRWFCVIVLESVASLAASCGELERAVRLLGAADTVLESIGVPLLARFRAHHDEILTTARGALGGPSVASAWADGKRRSLQDAIGLVGKVDRPADRETRDGLTAREIEVLALVADGRTDAEVAEALVVSVRTVHAHLRSIYRKLDLHTRSAATRYALEHGLVT